MPEQLQKIVQPIKTRWDALTNEQRIKLVSAILVVLLALSITVYFAVRTQYELFTNNLTAVELMPIETALTNEGIKHKRTNNGTALLVDKKRIADAKITIDSNPEVQGINFTFADALDRSGMGTTESTRRAMLIKAKETDLSQALSSFDGVVSARVSLHIPEPVRLLIPDDIKASASAILQTSRQLTREEGVAMARFLARGVEGLDLENIEIYDNQARTVFSGESESLGTGLNSATEKQERERQQLIRWINGMFASLWDEVHPVPYLHYDSVNAATTETTIYEIPVGSEDGLIDRESSERSNARNAQLPQEPGVGANDQTLPGYQAGTPTDSSASHQAFELSRIFNQLRRLEERGPDSYNRNESSITITLNRYLEYFQEKYIQNDRNFTQAQWDEMKHTARPSTISDHPDMGFYIQSASHATGIPENRITIFINEIPVFHDYTPATLDPQFIVMMCVLALLILMLAYGLIRRTKVEEDEEELEPELSVEDLLVSTQLEEAREEEVAQLEEIDYLKESEVKKQIEKFVNEKPEAVAALLRNWINAEEW
jgi:flagellar M-ring protein FliF